MTPFKAMKDLDSSSVNVFFSWVKLKSISYESLLAVAIALSQRPDVCGGRGLRFQLGAWNFRGDGSLVLRSFFKPHLPIDRYVVDIIIIFIIKVTCRRTRTCRKIQKKKTTTNISYNSHNQQ